VQSRVIKKTIGIAGISLFTAFIIIVTVLILQRYGTILANPGEIRKAAQGYGVWSFAFFIFCNILQTVFAPVPGHFINISAGIVFGTVRGIAISWVGMAAGGSMVMLLARYAGKKFLYYILAEKAFRFEAEISKKGLPFLLLLAVFPNPIGDGVFYLAGVTAIPLRLIMPAIFLGRIPGIILSVVIGDKLYGAFARQWIVCGIGILCTIVLYVAAGKHIEKLFERVWKRCLPRF
jgi:uncharacterized membrane protein YdjX (TVP38/TMEM64 family)